MRSRFGEEDYEFYRGYREFEVRYLGRFMRNTGTWVRSLRKGIGFDIYLGVFRV